MAIPSHIRLEFVTPERAIAKDDVDELQLPGLDGFFGVLPGHAPLLAALKPGEMWFRKGNVKEYAFLGGGFAEVVGDRVSILAPVAEKAEEIDLARAEAAKRRAEERLAAPKSDMDFERARVALLRAIARLDAAKQARPRLHS
jgi:F-type H+-transporting ATPase subunit epsilon